jgi:hypothetical protein
MTGIRIESSKIEELGFVLKSDSHLACYDCVLEGNNYNDCSGISCGESSITNPNNVPLKELLKLIEEVKNINEVHS